MSSVSSCPISLLAECGVRQEMNPSSPSCLCSRCLSQQQSLGLPSVGVTGVHTLGSPLDHWTNV